MTKVSIILACSTLLVLAGVPAFAQTTGVAKTWVSSTTGNDSGTCQFVTPCKTFAYAFAQTAPGGELDVKDSGSYGPLNITHAVNVVSAGALAAISVPPGGIGITINAGSNDKVIVHGLVIDGHGVGIDGIDFNSGMSLTVEHCHVRDVVSNGLSLQPEGAQSYYVSDTEVTNAGNTAIIILPSRSAAKVTLTRLDTHDNKTGISVGHSTAIMTNSTVDGNTVGIAAGPNGEIVLSQTTIFNNANYGVQIQSGGIVGSFGDNDVFGNAIYGEIGALPKS